MRRFPSSQIVSFSPPVLMLLRLLALSGLLALPLAAQPAAPTNLTAQLEQGQIVLQWADNATGETGYEVERAVNSGPWGIVHTGGADLTRWTDTAVQPGNAYLYRVRAVGDDGASLTDDLPSVIYHLTHHTYWESSYFANALYGANGWMEFRPGEWGSFVDIRSTDVFGSDGTDQFDAHGNPRYLRTADDGQTLHLRAIITGLHMNLPRPSAWGDRSAHLEGLVTVTWSGEADITLNGGTFVPSASNGAESGLLVDGRRTWLLSNGERPNWIQLWDLNTANPPTDIRVWLPDPADPTNRTLEGQLFHPYTLDRLRDRDWGVIRFKDWELVDASGVRDWIDRRLPGHLFMSGTLHPRPPVSGHPGGTSVGVAYEYMIMLANELGYDLWICPPHLTAESVDQYQTKLAQLIAFGSDGVNPYTEPVANPVYPPLRRDLKVYLEYSNEIWSSGFSFAQGDWAQQQADALGISKPQFNARQFSALWETFEAVLPPERVVRVAAVFTGLLAYTDPYIREFYDNPALLQPELMAVTTYWGNGIQHWVWNQPWFDRTRTWDDPYWTRPTFETDLQRTLDQLETYLLTGTAAGGSGPDAVELIGFGAHNAALAAEFDLPVIAYEGGPSIYVDMYDPDSTGAIAVFMEGMNLHPRFAGIYRTALEQSKALGLWSHAMFTDVGRWSRWGQWGHLHYLGQDPATAPKWQLMLAWGAEHDALRNINDPLGAVPAFTTPATLPFALAGQVLDQPITFAAGDGATSLDVIAERLPAGLSFDTVTQAITGTPTTAAQETGWLFLRINDTDGDPAWRKFQLTAFSPASGIAIDTDATALAMQWEPDAHQTERLLVVGPQQVDWGSHAWIGFDLNGLPGFTLASATLRVYVDSVERGEAVANPGPRTLVAYSGPDTWEEDALTWNTQPAIGGAVSPEVTIAGSGHWVELEVTAHLSALFATGDRDVSFVVDMGDNGGDHGGSVILGGRTYWDPTKVPELRLTFATE